MSWRTDLVSRLDADSALSTALGTRIGWFEASRNWDAYPQLVLQEISPGRDYTHDGPDGLDHPRVQFDIYGATPAQCETVEAALIAELEQAEVTQGGTRFFMARMLSRRSVQPDDLPDQKRVFRLGMDFEFHWETV